jgi:glycosyltransferase involved in cell wall biosynthesis
MMGYRGDRPGLIKYHWLEQEMAKISDFQWAGLGYPDFKFEKNLNDTVKRLYGDTPPDWVLIKPWDTAEKLLSRQFTNKNNIWTHIKIPRDRNYKVAAHIENLHGILGLSNKYRHLHGLLNEKGFDLIISRHRLIGKNKPIDFSENIDCQFYHCPAAINTDFAHPINEKQYDITLIGSLQTVYHLRRKIYNDIPSASHRNNWRYFLHKKSRPVIRKRSIDKLIKDGDYAGRTYYDLIAKSRSLIVGTSKYGYFTQKFVEAMSCETLPVSDAPLDSEFLHMKDGHNYVEVALGNWERKLKYYLDDENERLRVAQNGRRTVLKYHSSKVRAEQLVQFLKRVK